MTDGVTAAELQRAKAQLRAGLLMTLESPIARAGQMARHILVHGRPLTLEEMVAKVDAVDVGDIAALAQHVSKARRRLRRSARSQTLPEMSRHRRHG